MATVTHNGAEIQRAIADVPSTAARALAAAMNTTTRRAQFDVVARMGQVFDRPTPYALGGLRVTLASPQALQASVAVKGPPDAPGGAIPAQSFLRAEIEGGARHDKRSEILLRRLGVLPAGWQAVPGDGATLDGYGNVSRGQTVQILSYLQAFPQGGYRANSTEASRERLARSTRGRRGMTFFVVPPGTKGLTPGVWQRSDIGALGKGVRCVLRFVRGTTYRKRLGFYEVVETSIDTNLGRQFANEMTARAGT
jgi:hypothetical protein